MARDRSAYNTTDSPVVIDDEGHTLGGREHGVVDVNDPHVVVALERGALLLREDLDAPAPTVLDEPEQGEPELDQDGDEAAATDEAPAPPAPRARPSRSKPKE
jgi:hypothetical protein